jgi:hypothetical protein
MRLQDRRNRDRDHCGSSAGLMSRGRPHRSGVGKCATVQWWSGPGATSCGNFCCPSARSAALTLRANSFRAVLPRRVWNGIFGTGDKNGINATVFDAVRSIFAARKARFRAQHGKRCCKGLQSTDDRSTSCLDTGFRFGCEGPRCSNKTGGSD